jgi:hypothetical protein
MSYPDRLRIARDWDARLLENYGYGTWEFGLSLALTITDTDLRYGEDPTAKMAIYRKEGSREYIKTMMKQLDSLKKLKDQVLRNLIQYQYFFGKLDDGTSSQDNSDSIISHYRIRQFFNILNRDISGMEESLFFNTSYTVMYAKKGRPLDPVFLLGTLWAGIIKRRRGTDWRTVMLLMDWFSENLKEAKYWRVLWNKEIYEENLRKECHVIRKHGERAAWLEVLGNLYFPKRRREEFFKIEFNKDWINFGTQRYNVRGELITFPDGKSY